MHIATEFSENRREIVRSHLGLLDCRRGPLTELLWTVLKVLEKNQT